MPMGFFDYLSTSVAYILGFIVVMTLIIIWATTRKEKMNTRVSTHMKPINRNGNRNSGVYATV